jgi:hypothetical protein
MSRPTHRPTDTLAGCMWLARLTEKIRLKLAGNLDDDFQLPFCHPRATDGLFFTHFGLSKEDIVAAVEASAGDDEAVARWFLSRGADTAEKVAAWNECAPHLGRRGFPGEGIFAFREAAPLQRSTRSARRQHLPGDRRR